MLVGLGQLLLIILVRLSHLSLLIRAWLTNHSAFKVFRGGSWGNNPDDCRSATRIDLDPVIANYVIGFRVVCMVTKT